MKDRYLFKAKRTDNGEWVEGTLLHKSSSFSIECDEYYIFDGIETSSNDDLYVVDPTTICQCTGLKDKNGKLIWENDIVSYWDSYSTENGMSEADCIGKVVWDDETISFQVTNRLSAESWEVLDDECSVVGNAIDNPELLEVG